MALFRCNFITSSDNRRGIIINWFTNYTIKTILIFLICSSTYAQVYFDLGNASKLTNLTEFTNYTFLPKNLKFDPLKNHLPKSFKRISNKSIRSTYTENILWGKIDLANQKDKPIERFLFFDSGLTGNVSFFYRGKEYITGSSVPMVDRSEKTIHPALTITLAPKEKITIFFKQSGHHALSMKILVASKINYVFYQSKKENNLRYYIGAIIGLLFYNLLLASFFKSKKYIVYCLFTLSFLAVILNANGLLDYLSFPFGNQTYTHYLIITSSIVTSIALIFGYIFLEAKKYFPKLIPMKNIMVGLTSLPILLALSSFYEEYIVFFEFYMDAVIVLALLFLIFSCFLGIKKGSPLAKFYLLSWVFLTCGSVLYFGNIYTVFPKNDLTDNGLLLGNIFEIIILSLALGYQSAVLDKENSEVLIKAEEKEKYQHLLRTISHDISNSLQVLVLGTRRLMRSTEDNRILMIAKRMESSTTNVVEILEHVKSQEKLLLDKKGLTLSKVNLLEVINGAILIYEDVLIQKNVIVRIDIPSDLKLIKAEKVSLKNNVLGNILSNSIKFSENNSEIKITAENLEDHVILMIRDYGTGFSQEALKFINEDFPMTFSTVGTQGEMGTGFGLRIIKSYVNLYKGSLEANNDGGAIFKIKFKC